MSAPSICPHCGAEVPSKAKSCPQCGSDETTGWSDEAYASKLDLPDDSFDYDQFVEREFGGKKSSPSGLPWFWWIIAILLLAAILWLWLR